MGKIDFKKSYKQSLQSPNLTLIAAGSTGRDGSVPGTHLRWTFGGDLAEKHLPKGNLADPKGYANFNKPQDFVRIYKAPYIEQPTVLDFSYMTPQRVFSDEAKWLYDLKGKYIYVKFMEKERYSYIEKHIDPYRYPRDFIMKYDDAPIEVECVNELFFAVTLLAENNGSDHPFLLTETYSSKYGYMGNDLYTNSRKIYNDIEFPARILCENGRAMAYSGAFVPTIIFEFYIDFIINTNDKDLWADRGNFALSLNDNEVFSRLDPYQWLTIDQKWPRFVDGATVNKWNYMDKWNGFYNNANDPFNIKRAVMEYIALSDDPKNPTGIINIPLTDNVTDETDTMQMSLVSLLNAGAMDFHVARMLGLGAIDNMGYGCIYVAEYFTEGRLLEHPQDTLVQHLSMSLPVSQKDERLPYPISIAAIRPGMANDSSSDSLVAALTNPDGYTPDGRSRFVTLIAEQLPSNETRDPFFKQRREFNLSERTFPVHAGLQYKGPSDNDWIKPDLSHDAMYNNPPDGQGRVYNETVPITVDDVSNVIYLHCHKESGTHTYKSYGINIFSRVCESPNSFSIDTQIAPANSLNPPDTINALLVREENPLMLTSQLEQSRFAAITNTDKTLVRLSFNYENERVIDKVDIESGNFYSDTQLESNNCPLYPNNQDAFANAIEIYFRNSIPKNVSGKVVSIVDDTYYPGVSVIKTASYTLSNGETILPSIPAADVSKYIGGLFVLGKQQFVIQSIIPSATSPILSVLKIKLSPDNSPYQFMNPEDHYQAPEITDANFLFMVIENMQTISNWGRAHSLKVQIPATLPIKREIFYRTNPDGMPERYLEKSRGFWKTANIEAVKQPIEDANGNVINDYAGLYKITFPNFHLLQSVSGGDNNMHSQYNANGISVEWHNGIVRLKRKPADNQNGEREVFEVLRMDDLPTGLVVYIQDPDFEGINHNNAIKTGNSILINYYPGYKLYLYADANVNLISNAVLPQKNEGVRYSIFGLRAYNSAYNYYSKLSSPTLMFAQEISQPQIPDKPLGSLYATRPDFFGKASYAFVTTFKHVPDNVLFARSNDILLLNALYSETTIQKIQSELENLGGYNEEFLSNRWLNFFDLAQLRTKNKYESYPATNGFVFPFPDGENFIDFINDFIRGYNKNPRNMKEVILNEALQNVSTIPLSNNLSAQLQKEYAGGTLIQKDDIPTNKLTSMSETTVQNFLKNLNIKVENLRKKLPTSFNAPIISSGNTTLFDLTDLVQQAVLSTFIPLTEFPLPYNYIKSGNYTPQSKKQNIKDGAGYLLAPTDPAFDPAPMAKIVTGASPSVLFTDFTLDGTTNNIYFYAAMEIGTQMQMGNFSDILGPVKLVNTKPPEAPAIKSIIPVSGNEILGIKPSVRFEINAYSAVENIRRISIYRTFSPLDAQSVRLMTKVKDWNVNDAIPDNNTNDNNIWVVSDDFSDLAETPYEQLYYRITAAREVKYAEGKNANNEDIIRTEYAPSLPSKITATLMVENTPPPAPTLQFSSGALSAQGTINNVILNWNKTAYKGKYYLYKMNAQGNWMQIAEIASNDNTIYMPLIDTDLQSNALHVRDNENNPIYHHFKVTAENSSGIFSSEENILTISASNP